MNRLKCLVLGSARKNICYFTKFGLFLFVSTVPTDCIVEGEVLKLGGPFLQTWQKKHLKLYPNRLEFYHKNRDGLIVKGKGVEVSSVNVKVFGL